MISSTKYKLYFIEGLGILLGMILPLSLYANGSRTITIVNQTSKDHVIYFQIDNIKPIPQATQAFYKNLNYPCIFPENSYSGDGNVNTCHFSLPQGESQVMPLNVSAGLPEGKFIVAVSAQQDHFPQGPCNTTIAELTLNDNGRDAYDISLVNGQNFNMEISSDKPSNNPSITLNSNNLEVIKKTLGVFPPGCSRCVDGLGVPPAWQGNGTTTQNCPGYGKPAGPMPKGSCKSGEESDPKPNFCQLTSMPTGANYTVTFSDM